MNCVYCGHLECYMGEDFWICTSCGKEQRIPCPECRLTLLSIPKKRQESYLICPECETILLLYVPQPHQAAFHADGHKIKAYFGGYGSGKTRTAAEEVIRHILETPGGTTLIGAQTYPQLNETAKDMFMKCFPDDLIEKYNKKEEKLIVKNGHTVLFRSFDEEGKIRSLNLTCFWIEEASEVKYEIYDQLTTRLRNPATKRHLGVLSSNPDIGWIREEILLKADEIHGSDVEYHQEEKNPDISVHIAATKLNKYLPPGYIESISRGKPKWWIRRYLEGSFQYSEGMVYPQVSEHIIPPQEIPEHWERMFGADFGLRHPTVFLAAAIDPEKGVVHIYREHYEALKPVEYHAKKMLEMMQDVPPGLIRFVVGDPAGKKRSEKDFRSLYDHYAEHGVYFKPGSNKLLDGIIKVYSYLEAGHLKIHANCVNTIREALNYKYKPAELDEEPDEKPIDKDNHAMDALRYIIAELPDNPKDLINPSYSRYQYYDTQRRKNTLPHALRDDDEFQALDWAAYYAAIPLISISLTNLFL